MIQDVVKYLILGTREDLGHFFSRAQEQGFLEFISISQKKALENEMLEKLKQHNFKIMDYFTGVNFLNKSLLFNNSFGLETFVISKKL